MDADLVDRPANAVLQLATLQIVPEREGDHAAIERVCDRAFGPGRFAKVSERVRESAALDRGLSRVALDGARVVGCCRLYRIAVGGAPALFLGPLAVDPETQRLGLGQALVRDAVRDLDLPVVLVGQPSFFEPLGFVRIPEGRITLPGPVEARRLHWRGSDETLAALSGALTGPRAAS